MLGRQASPVFVWCADLVGAAALGHAIAQKVEDRGLYRYGIVSLTFGRPDRWLQPDVTVLTEPESGVWVPIERCLLPVEFVSPESRRRDRIDKPKVYAERGVPWYMTVELDVEREHAAVALYRLVGRTYRTAASAFAGQVFDVKEPFEVVFDPAQLLVR